MSVCYALEYLKKSAWSNYSDTTAQLGDNSDICICFLIAGVCLLLRFVRSWRDLISQLVVSDHSQDGFTITDIIDCVKWELSRLIRIPGSRLHIALDLQSLQVQG